MIESHMSFVAHLRRQYRHSLKTFGPWLITDMAPSHLDHITKELHEIAEDPANLEEWIDVVLIALDGALRTGASPTKILSALIAKQQANEARQWPAHLTKRCPTAAFTHIEPKR